MLFLAKLLLQPLGRLLLLLCVCTHVAPSTIMSQFSPSPVGSGDWPQRARLAQHAPLPTEPHCPSLVAFLASSGDLLFES